MCPVRPTRLCLVLLLCRPDRSSASSLSPTSTTRHPSHPTASRRSFLQRGLGAVTGGGGPGGGLKQASATQPLWRRMGRLGSMHGGSLVVLSTASATSTASRGERLLGPGALGAGAVLGEEGEAGGGVTPLALAPALMGPFAWTASTAGRASVHKGEWGGGDQRSKGHGQGGWEAGR